MDFFTFASSPIYLKSVTLILNLYLTWITSSMYTLADCNNLNVKLNRIHPIIFWFSSSSPSFHINLHQTVLICPNQLGLFSRFMQQCIYCNLIYSFFIFSSFFIRLSKHSRLWYTPNFSCICLFTAQHSEHMKTPVFPQSCRIYLITA